MKDSAHAKGVLDTSRIARSRRLVRLEEQVKRRCFSSGGALDILSLSDLSVLSKVRSEKTTLVHQIGAQSGRCLREFDKDRTGGRSAFHAGRDG